MTEEEMWRAVRENDSAYDGRFFYGVVSTGIYCRPSCPSKVPKREHVRFFETAQQAQAAGFRPCKRCRSDLWDYRPDRELAQQIEAVLNRRWREPDVLDRLPQEMGVSRRRLTEVFQTHRGVTPWAYVRQLRLEEAQRLLQQTQEPIIEIAAAVGFGSSAAFYRTFRQGTGTTPTAYRKEHL